jgi:selenocysteine lyase/cysteine desulfurase
MTDLEKYFTAFRRHIIGFDQQFTSPYGMQKIIYADWTASGRLYGPIEEKLMRQFGPFVGNTHSESSVTGGAMTQAYRTAHKIIKTHVHAGPGDVILTMGSGMTSVVNKFQRILGLKVPEQIAPHLCLPKDYKPVVFLTHMEHHSNQTTWLETIAEVVVTPPDQDGLVDLNRLRETVQKYKDRPLKIGSFTACSNVTGIRTAYHEMAKIMHEVDGLCFVDLAASAPYMDIDMHPEHPLERLDALFFSPHKFLGGPGTPGVLVFNSTLYRLQAPDQPGGGTVNWTNPWGGHSYIQDVEVREDGGTPAFLQTIRAALGVRLKEKMGVQNMLQREHEMLPRIFKALQDIPGLHILAEQQQDRLGVFSFFSENIHYNLFVKLLNDRFGVQVRGGCSCAGTYGHYLLHVDPTRSHRITEKIDHGDLSEKPGWVRLSIHPTMGDEELDFLLQAVRETVRYAQTWQKDYVYDKSTNEFHHRDGDATPDAAVAHWFDLDTLR